MLGANLAARYRHCTIMRTPQWEVHSAQELLDTLRMTTPTSLARGRRTATGRVMLLGLPYDAASSLLRGPAGAPLLKLLTILNAMVKTNKRWQAPNALTTA